jgi:REP element-mobilizing transposase RayT
MTNHVHLIIGHSGTTATEDIIGHNKRHTSEMLHKAIVRDVAESRREWMMDLFTAAGKMNSNNKSGFQLWQQHNRPIELYTREVIIQKLSYIHNNPVKAGFVDQPHEWAWSSAKDYAGMTGLLKDVNILEFW